MAVQVIALTRYQHQGASSRVRFYQYLPYLEAQGIDVTVAPFFGDSYLERLYASGRRRVSPALSAYLRRLRQLLSTRRYDLIWTQYEVLPWLPAWVERSLAHTGIPQVIDFDDAVFEPYRTHRNPVARRLLAGKIEQVMRRSSAVVAGNDFLAEYARRAGAARVETLPTVVDLQRYQACSRRREGGFTIGWIGTPLSVAYLESIAGVLSRACRDGAELTLVGAGSRSPAGLPARIRPWSHATEVADIQQFDVGIMPLADSRLMRGKCGYKLIQYMACGKPVIASPVGANVDIVEPGVTGFLPRDGREWEAALGSLRADPANRRRMGEAGRERVAERYCIGQTAPRLAAILKSAAAERSARR